MLAQKILLQWQKYNFVLMAREEASGRQGLRYLISRTAGAPQNRHLP